MYAISYKNTRSFSKMAHINNGIRENETAIQNEVNFNLTAKRFLNLYEPNRVGAMYGKGECSVGASYAACRQFIDVSCRIIFNNKLCYGAHHIQPCHQPALLLTSDIEQPTSMCRTSEKTTRPYSIAPSKTVGGILSSQTQHSWVVRYFTRGTTRTVVLQSREQ